MDIFVQPTTGRKTHSTFPFCVDVWTMQRKPGAEPPKSIWRSGRQNGKSLGIHGLASYSAFRIDPLLANP